MRDLLALRGARRVLAGSLTGRIPTPIMDVALVVFLAQRFSYATAGVGVALFSGVGACAGILQSRWVDRRGGRVLVALSVVHVGAGALLLGAHAETLALGACLLAGVSRPGVACIVRAGWSHLARCQRRAGAPMEAAINRLETICSQGVTVIGPLLAFGCFSLLSYGFAIGLAVVMVALGALMLVGVGGFFHRADADGGDERRGAPAERSPWRTGAYLLIVVCDVFWGAAVGALQVGLPAQAHALHEANFAPILWASIPLGGMLWTMWAASRFGADWTMHRAMAVAADSVAPSRLTEAYAGKVAAIYVGSALGAVGAGVLADHAPRLALALVPVCFALGALIAYGARRLLSGEHAEA